MTISRMMCATLAAGLALAACVRADEPARPAAPAQAATPALRCALDEAPAAACTLDDSVDKNGTHTMEFTLGERRVRFVGTSQTGWWSGQLDGRPAMGYELNRGHTVFSTVDLKNTFEWWSQGSEHGSY